MNQEKVLFFSFSDNYESCRILKILQDLGFTIVILRSSLELVKLQSEIKIAVFDKTFVRIGNKLWQTWSVTGKRVPRWASAHATHCLALECGSKLGSFCQLETAACEIGVWTENHHFSLPEKVQNVAHRPRQDRMGSMGIRGQLGGVTLRHYNRNKNYR